MILVGQPTPGAEIVIPNAIQLFNGTGQSIRATQGGDTRPQEDIPKYLRFFAARKIEIGRLITHRYKLESINTAFETLKTGKSGRIMISMEEEC